MEGRDGVKYNGFDVVRCDFFVFCDRSQFFLSLVLGFFYGI